MTQIQSNDKLYIITRKDLSPGYQGVQSQHAAFEFAIQHPEITREWHAVSNYLCFLSVVNEDELYSLISQAKDQGIRLSVFREPDIDNAITAIALEPGEKSKALCSRLSLALRDIK